MQAGRASMASMEPGHEDREYDIRFTSCLTAKEASMEPGHEDREYPPNGHHEHPILDRLNGARS